MNREKGGNFFENIKSALLVVLFLFTILLLYFFWSDKPLQMLVNIPDEGESASIPLEALLQPSRVVVGIGESEYILRPDALPALKASLQSFSQGENISATEIPAEKYDEAMRGPSVRMVFDYYLPFDVACDLFGLERIPGGDGADAVTELGFSEADPSSAFLYDAKRNRYFRFVGDRGDKYFDALSQIITDETNASLPTYYTLGYLSGGTDNRTLFPVFLESSATDFAYAQDFSVGEEAKVAEMARRFFSDNFDFVRKIEERSGTIIYMYGYGQLVFIADPSGTFEFKREGEKSAPSVKYEDALRRACQFIADHGGVKTLNEEQVSIYLKEAVSDPEGRKGFRFVFGLMIDGNKVSYQNGAPLIVEVSGDTVVYFKRDFIQYDAEELQEEESPREVVSAMNALALNYEYVQNVWMQVHSETPVSDEATAFEDIAGRVTGLDFGYVRLADEGEPGGTIRAAWILRLGEMEFFFDPVEAAPLGYAPYAGRGE